MSNNPPNIKLLKPIDIQQQLRTSKLANNVANMSLYQPQLNNNPTTSNNYLLTTSTDTVTNILSLQNNFNSDNQSNNVEIYYNNYSTLVRLF